MNILCIIPARGGSRGLKNKNIKLLLGKPLIGYTIDAALESKRINKIVVSTDDLKIAKVAYQYKVQVIKRPKKYSTDRAPIELALTHAVEYLANREGYLADIVVSLQANVPIRKTGQIDNVISQLINSDADSAATVYQVNQFPQWMKKMDEKGFLSNYLSNCNKYRRQDLEPLYLLDGAIIAVKREVLIRAKHLPGVHVYLGRRIKGIVQNRKFSLEVDSEEDLSPAKFSLMGFKGKE